MISRNRPDAARAWTRLGVGATLALALTAGAAAEPLNASYPRSRALPDVAAWLASDTPLQPGQVVDVGPSAVTAVISSSPTGDPRGFLAQIAAEALDPAIGRQEEIVSWTIPVAVDCDKRLVRLGDMTGYPSRDLKAAPRVVRAADTAWVAPSVNAPLGAVMRALCDRDFKRPLAGITRAAARPAPSPDAPKPAKPLRTTPIGPPPPVLTETPPTAAQPLTAAAAKTAKETPHPAHGGSAVALQIGASPTEELAKASLAKLQRRFPEVLKGFKTDVQTAQVDGKAVYRAVVTGFAGAADANTLCQQLKAGGQDCFIRR